VRALLRSLCCAAVVVAATASCSGSTTAPTRTTPASQSQPATFPLTITRTGGIAGLRDVVVVAGDGLVSVTHKGHTPHLCQLAPLVLAQLTAAAAQVPWSQITVSPRPSLPDDMVTTIQSPAGGPIRLDARVAAQTAKVFVELLNDLNGGAPTSRLCPTR
jgi:hypothetical protein